MAQWLELHASTAGAWVQSLIGDLRFCKPQSVQKNKKNHSREVLKPEETMKDNGANTTDLQVRDLGCTEGRWQQQGWKAGFLAPGGFILEGTEGELQLLGAAEGQRGGQWAA